MAQAASSGDYDYIIVGGGLAGCVLASRLHTKNPSLSILIIEAGPNPDGHPLTSAPLACFGAHHSDLDWDYKTAPQQFLDGRECYAAAGKVLSGGNAINYGTWTRGPRTDYDHWADIVGDQGWSYEGLLPYFKRSEHYYGDAKTESAQHGFHGPIYNVSALASDPQRIYPLRDNVLDGWKSLSVKQIEDGNAGSPSIGISELVENWRDGKRQPVSNVYDLTGVQIMTNTVVARITITPVGNEWTATGVELVDGRYLCARNEVIVSAGAYRSSQLLMLSGIGPSAELSKHSIPVLQDRPDVGQNFFDHLYLPTFWKLANPENGQAMGSSKWTHPALFKGLPGDWVVTSRAPDAEMKTALSADDAPDSVRSHLLDPATPHSEILVVYAPAGAELTDVSVPIDGTYIGTPILGMATTSRGSITLRSSKVTDAPVIDPNYYATAVDRVVLRSAVRQVMTFMTSEQMAGIIECERPPDGYPALSAESEDEEIDRRIRRAGNTIYHAAGGCSMGRVVDTHLRVKGVKGLRVCDASVIPTSVAAHLQVPVLAIAEKGAALIANDCE